jgi:hypothetical protein
MQKPTSELAIANLVKMADLTLFLAKNNEKSAIFANIFIQNYSSKKLIELPIQVSSVK